LAVLLAMPVARLARRDALAGPLRIALGVVLPIVLVTLLAASALGVDAVLRVAPGLLIWLAGLAPVLWAAAALATRGRIGAAWCVGVLGALLAADLTVLLTVSQLPQANAVDPLAASLWVFTGWTGWPFAGTGPSGTGSYVTTPQVAVQSVICLAYTPYALAYAISAARRGADVTVAAQVDGLSRR
ncbi:MAG TPA: hypothetical protein VGD43_07190, partial [Micromonospora sp.]